MEPCTFGLKHKGLNLLRAAFSGEKLKPLREVVKMPIAESNLLLLVFKFCCCVCSDSKKPGAFDKHDFELLAPVLDGFSLMTYDYSSHGRYSSKYAFPPLISIFSLVSTRRF